MATYYVDGAVGSDSNAGTSAGAGNAWATLGKFQTSGAAGDTCYVKASATYTLTGTFTPPAGGLPNGTPTRVIGYTATPGDGGRPLVDTASALSPMVAIGGNCWVINFELDGTDTAVGGVLMGNRNAQVQNCLVRRCTTYGISGAAGGNSILGCEVTDLKAGATAGIVGSQIVGCWVHDSPGIGIDGASSSDIGSFISRCIVSGMGSDGYMIGSLGHCMLMNSVSYGNAGNGVYNPNTYEAGSVINCIIYGNNGYGIRWGYTIPATGNIDFNAIGGNTSGPRLNVTAGPNDVALTADPFTNAAAGDFSLNSTAGGGAACKAVGYEGV